jgi:hypothetical protein
VDAEDYEALKTAPIGMILSTMGTHGHDRLG